MPLCSNCQAKKEILDINEVFHSLNAKRKVKEIFNEYLPCKDRERSESESDSVSSLNEEDIEYNDLVHAMFEEHRKKKNN